MSEGGLLLVVLSAIGFLWPRLLAWPLAAFGLWLGLALLARASRRLGRGTGAPAQRLAAVSSRTTTMTHAQAGELKGPASRDPSLARPGE